MWRPGLDPGRKNSSLFGIICQRPDYQERGAHATEAVPYVEHRIQVDDEYPDTQDGAQEDVTTPRLRPPQAHLPSDQLSQSSHSFQCHNQNGYTHEFTSLPQETSNSLSPCSDTTLCVGFVDNVSDECSMYAGVETHTSIETPKVELDNLSSERQCPLIRSTTTSPLRKHVPRHRRDISTDSCFSITRTPSRPLRVRAKTSDGMLQFKANVASHQESEPSPRNRHRRKISLHLPVNVPIPSTPGTTVPVNLSGWTESPNRAPKFARSLSTPLTSEERELEYKHRHTFIGTASLDDLLEVLEVSADHTTTKGAVMKAFISLAYNEQVHARQCSAKPNGWELVPRVTPDTSNIDYVAQLQVKLGSITLRQFLDMIPFDHEDEVGALRVVEAFSAASHIDTTAGVGTGSKARAFRSWMIDLGDAGTS